MENDRVLSYGSVVLRRSDLEILQGPYFLNDRIIEFYFCYLESMVSQKVLLVSPSTSFWIQNSLNASELLPFVEPLNFSQRELIVFPVNDNNNVEIAEGGSHWSVLVYNRKRNIFEHYDSSRRSNSLYAKQLYNNIKAYVDPPEETAAFIEPFTPQQKNNYDCGDYVLAIVKELCTYQERASNEDWESVLKANVTEHSVSQMRREILETISSLCSRS